MGLPIAKILEFEVGKYVCPVTKSRVALMATYPADVVWPQVVERCVSCGQKHILQYDDIEQRLPPGRKLCQG
ncbi:MAG: hypothetical protein V3U28_01165 [Candidatus Acidoferrales bacterium]